MTNEELDRANDLSAKMREIRASIEVIKPYLGQKVEITFKKNDGRHITYTAYPRDTLCLAVVKTLEDKYEQLKSEFESIGKKTTIVTTPAKWWKLKRK